MPDTANTVKTDNGIEVYENNISLYLDQYMKERNIDNMNAESMNRWNAALMYINKALFKGTDILKADNYCTGNLLHGNASNNGAYDIDKVNAVCDIYIGLCYEYEKEISIMGFSNLTGISRDTLHQWGAETSRPGSSASDIYKKLTENREESLSNRLYSGKGHPVGVLGILNRHYGWNMGQPRGNSSTQTQSIEQIQQRYGIEQQQDREKLAPPEADF